MKKIILYSPVRTGSTLIYNFLKNLINDDVLKTHSYCYYKKYNIVVTIRHPYNSILSLILLKEKIKSKEDLKNITNEKLIYWTNHFIEYGGKTY